MTQRRLAVAVVGLLVVLGTAAASAGARPSQTQPEPTTSSTGPTRPRPTGFGPVPVSGDCRDAGGKLCINTPRTGKLTTSPKTLREGETLTVTVTLLPGGVSYSLQDFSLPQGQDGGCADKTEERETEVQDSSGRWVLDTVPVPVEGTCEFKPGPTGGGWAIISAGITGPCGSQIAVQEGRAEFAACAGTYASDYYGVYPKDAAVLKGKVTHASSGGPGAPGVPIVVTGDSGVQYLSTRSDGTYDAELEPGRYTVRPLGSQEDGDATDSPSDTDEAFKPKTLDVTLSEGKDTQADFVMQGVELSGHVRDEPAEGEDVGAPVEGVQMKVYKDGKEIRSLRTNSDGLYATTVKDGTYTVRPEYSQRAADRDLLAGRIRDSGFEPEEEEVSIKGEKRDDVDFEVSDELIFQITIDGAEKKSTVGGAETNDFTLEEGFRKGQLLMTMHVTNVLGDPVRNHDIFFEPSKTLTPRMVVCGIDGRRLRPATAPPFGEKQDDSEFTLKTDGSGDIQMTLLPGSQDGPWRMFFRDAEDEKDETDVMEIDLEVERASNTDSRLNNLGATLKQLFPSGVGIPAGTGIASAGTIDERINNLLEHLEGQRNNPALKGLDWAPVTTADQSDTAVIVFPAGLSDAELDGLLAQLQGTPPSGSPGTIASAATVITSANTEQLAKRTSVGGAGGPQLVQTLPDDLEPLAAWLLAVGGARYGRHGAGSDEIALTYFGWPHPGGCTPGPWTGGTRVTQHSPVGLEFTAADGKRFGFDEDGELVSEIVNASMFSTDDAEQLDGELDDDVITYRLPEGQYTVAVHGTDDGDATLEVRPQAGSLPTQVFELEAEEGESGTFAMDPSGVTAAWRYAGAEVTRHDGLDFDVEGVPAALPTDPYTDVELTITDELDRPVPYASIEWGAQNGSGKAYTDRSGTATIAMRGGEGAESTLRITVPGAPPKDLKIPTEVVEVAAEPTLDEFVNAAFDAGALSGSGGLGGGGGGLPVTQILLLVGVAGAGAWFVRRQQAAKRAPVAAGAAAAATDEPIDEPAAALPPPDPEPAASPKPARARTPAAAKKAPATKKAATKKAATKRAAPRKRPPPGAT